MWGTIFWVYYSPRTYIYLNARNYFLSVLLSEDIHLFTCEEIFSACTTLWGHTYIYMWRTIDWMYYSLRTYICLHVRNYCLNVLLSKDIHIFTCEELFFECTTLWRHTYIYMLGTIFWMYYSLRTYTYLQVRNIVWMHYSPRTYIYLHARNYCLSALMSEDIHIFTCEEIFSECTTL